MTPAIVDVSTTRILLAPASLELKAFFGFSGTIAEDPALTLIRAGALSAFAA